MKVHPVAELFPMLSDAELQALADDIKKNGQQQSCITQNGLLLDGRNRMAACKLAGVTATVRELAGDRDATQFIISANIHRRHLTESQRAMVAARLANLGDGIRKDRSANLPTSAVTQPEAAKLLNVSERSLRDAKLIQREDPELAKDIDSGKLNINAAKREVKRKGVVTTLENISTKKAKAIKGVYDVVVIDPPWPMEKIERDCRPNQSEMDYPTMTLEEIARLDIGAKYGADDCHVWLWTTHKLLPYAFRLLTDWELKYVCCHVWHKPGGFQVVGLPQFNCEFALYARKGNPSFIDTKAFPVCFNAPRGKHSEKPSEFYDVVRRVTAGRRLDMFSRRTIQGFDAYGNEAKT